MTLSIPEAEGILSRVFRDELGPIGSVQITRTGSTGGIDVPAHTIDQLLGYMTKASMKIDAIKLCREIHPGMGLAEAKAYVENLP